MKKHIYPITLIAFILSFDALADGVDRQEKHDVNYWSGLNNYHTYNHTLPHLNKKKSLDDQYCWWKKVGGTWVDTCEVDNHSHGEYTNNHNHKQTPVSVPEPETLGLLGAACLFFAIKKRKNKA